MTRIRILPPSEVAGRAATSITRFERILRNLKEKRADVPVVNASDKRCIAHFILQTSANTTKNVRAKNFRRISFSKIYRAELEQRYTTNI
jgi:hypothetical protein